MKGGKHQKYKHGFRDKVQYTNVRHLNHFFVDTYICMPYTFLINMFHFNQTNKVLSSPCDR